MKYCKVKTADGYPVSVPQIRQLQRNIDWCRNSRINAVGVYGRVATDAFAVVDGDVLFFPPMSIDLSFYNTLHFGVVVDGVNSAVWEFSLSMTGGGTEEILLSMTNPGSAAVYTGSCSPPYSHPRVCTPQLRITKVSGAGTLSMRFAGFWMHRTEDAPYGPENLQPAAAADLQSAMSLTDNLLAASPCLIGWFGEYMMPPGSTTAFRWFALGDKNDDDTTTESVINAEAIVAQTQINAGKYWQLTHTENNAGTLTRYLPDSASGIYTPVEMPVASTSYDTTTPWSGGKIEAAAGADSIRPYIIAVGVHRKMSTATLVALQPAHQPLAGRQIRTVEAAGAVGINDIAEYIHKCSWYQCGNTSGALVEGAGKAFTISTTKVTVFDGLIWVRDDAQSGATWGANSYEVALRAANSSTDVTMTCTLTVDGQSASAPLTFAAGENYLTFSVSLTNIDITKYAVACRVELANSASRTTTVYSVQISRRGAAY